MDYHYDHSGYDHDYGHVYGDGDDYDWGSVPDFPDLSQDRKHKCCPEGNILDQSGGVWSCVQDSSKTRDVVRVFTELASEDFGNELEIQSLEGNLEDLCNSNESISIWRPSSIDFTDDLAISADREEFFKCIDVTRDILTDQLYPVVASCVQQDQSQICESGETERICYLVFGVLSILAMTAALVVYALLPKQLLNIHGKVGRFSLFSVDTYR